MDPSAPPVPTAAQQHDEDSSRREVRGGSRVGEVTVAPKGGVEAGYRVPSVDRANPTVREHRPRLIADGRREERAAAPSDVRVGPRCQYRQECLDDGVAPSKTGAEGELERRRRYS